MKKILFISLISTLFLTNISLCQEGKTFKDSLGITSKEGVGLPTTTPTSPEDHINFSPYQQQQLDYYLFLVDMLKSKINLYNLKNAKNTKDSKEAENLTASQDKLTIAYEALTELYCMPYLYSTLEYNGKPTNSICLTYLKEIEERIPNSPIIPCVKLGIDDPECISRYEDQYFSTFNVEKLSSEEIKLKDKLEYEKKGSEIQKLLESINKNQEKYLTLANQKNSKNMEFHNLKKELRKDYAKLLDLQCNIELTRIVHKEPEGINKFKITPKQSVADPDFYALLKNIPEQKEGIVDESSKKENKNSKNPVEQVWRIRLIDNGCKNSVDNALSVLNNFPYAVCAYYGKLTPNCIQAWRAYKTQLESEKKVLKIKEPETGPGFSTF